MANSESGATSARAMPRIEIYRPATNTLVPRDLTAKSGTYVIKAYLKRKR